MDLTCDEDFLSSPSCCEFEQQQQQQQQQQGDSQLAGLHQNRRHQQQQQQLTDFPPRDNAALASVLNREASLSSSSLYVEAVLSCDNMAATRSSAVNWMLNARSVHGFSPLTAALSVSYLDRYLSTHFRKPLKAWAIQLISVACFSLAAKMEEVMVPCLMDLQAAGLDHVFEAKTIQRMEIVILKALGWRMSGVTAFEYLDDLLHRLDLARHARSSVLARTTELILGTLPVSEFLCFQPSLVVMSAISCALEETVPLKANACQEVLLSAIPVKQDALDDCCKLMEELVIDPLCPLLGQALTNPKSPPSPLTVIELSAEAVRRIEWPEQTTGRCAKPRKRKLEASQQSSTIHLWNFKNKRRSSDGGCSNSSRSIKQQSITEERSSNPLQRPCLMWQQSI